MNFFRPPSLQEAMDALGGVYRALRAWKFYPKGHPSRKASMQSAHQDLLLMLGGNDLHLACGRTGFSLPDGEQLKDPSRMASALSYELFIRRAQKITILGDLLQDDLFNFLRVLALTPDEVQRSGGLDRLMEDQGIRTVWLNEFDLSIIRRRRQEIESRGVSAPRLDELDEVVDAAEPDQDRNPEYDLQTLLGRLTAASDGDSYTILVRQALGCADLLLEGHQIEPLIPLVELLANHAEEQGERASCARFGLDHLSAIPDLLDFLLEHADDAHGISRTSLRQVLFCAGPGGITAAIEKIGSTESIALRKVLTLLLVQLGEPAVRPILKLIEDPRWYIVRNLAAILGDIGSQEAVPDLQRCLAHSDIRVCKEAIRSLAKIGGNDAEQAIIAILRDNNPSLQPQAVASLGGMKSRRALGDLLQIACSNDTFLKQLALKVDAVTAIALIGDRKAVPYLVDLLESRHLVARSRWDQYKVAVAGSLGRLGDSRALPALRKRSFESGDVARACAEAVEMIERMGDIPDGSA